MYTMKSSLLSDNSEEARRVRLARARMHAGDEPDPSFVRPLILESWRRSRDARVNPQWGTKDSNSTPQLSQSGVHSSPKYASTEQRLVDVAGPILQLLTDALSVCGFVLMLTDRHCRTLWLSGTDAFIYEAERVNSVVGGQWREDSIGTDAVALSHAIGEPVQVHWFEHYTSGLDPWTGNSCPIRDPATHEVISTINVYAYGCIAHPRAFELSKDAASMIERQLALGDYRRRVRLLEAYEIHTGRYPDDPVVCLTPQGAIVGLSSSACGSLQTSGADARGRLLSSLPGIGFDVAAVEFDSLVAPQDVKIRCRDGRIPAEIRPIHEDSEVAGFLLRLRPTAGRQHSNRLDATWQARHRFDDIVGESSAIRLTIADARRIAQRENTVLILGESGTGKELMAHAIHTESSRSSGPFVPLNCGGMGGELLAAELFGYEDGAFTGAARGGRAGKLELADRGTLFLDEIETMSAGMQVHLLRFLEEHTVIRVGATRPRNVDVRVVGATNVDLRQLIRTGLFRADLYYRLNVCAIQIPPLRERTEDIGQLAKHILREERLEVGLDAEAFAILERYEWPGNVRELRNILVQAAMRSASQQITAANLQLPDELPMIPAAARVRGDVLGDAELDAIRGVLKRHAGKIGAAAAELGVHRVTLYRKLKRHGLNWTQGYR